RAARLRALLAALLVDANRVVPTGELVDRLWDATPPPGARGTLHSYVMRLRRILGDGSGRDPIVTRPDGYLIEVDGDALDLQRFTTLVQEAAGEPEPALVSARLATALELWRGEPLSDVSAEFLVRNVVPALTEQRLAAIEQRVEVDLGLGRHHEVITELRELTERYPLRENFWAQLMLALYRSDRQAEALDCYRRLGELLAEELGIGPGPYVRARHRAILTNDPSLDLTPTKTVAPQADPVTVPRQLPAGGGRLRGRADDLAGLDKWLADAEADPALPLLAAIVGPGGIGKTALAVRWAHRIGDRFPDGHLYVDLHGYGPDPATSPDVALETLLHGLRVAPERIPAALPERAALFRSMCSGRRLLIVLDNARDDAHMRPLLPGPGSLVLVTSRSQLRGLIAREGAHRVALGPISVPATAELLGDVVDVDPAAFEPSAVARLVDLCAGLPLAVRVVAERMARDGHSLADVIAELRATDGLLDALGSGDDDLTDVRAVLSWSYQALDPDTARAFRLLGAQPGRDISLAAASVLLGEPPSATRRLLDRLIGTHLLTRRGPGRYGFHDLLRAYATERFRLAGDDLAPIHRLLDWYLRMAANARQMLHPTTAENQIDLPDPPNAPPFTELTAALDWLNVEYPTLVLWIDYTANNGIDDRCWQLAWALGVFFSRRAMLGSWIAVCGEGITAAKRSGSYRGRAHMLNGLGGAYMDLGDFDRSMRCFVGVLRLAEPEHDTFLQAAALCNLGVVHARAGNTNRALAYHMRSLDLYQSVADCDASRINLYVNIGDLLVKLGRHEEAIEYLDRGMALVRESEVDRAMSVLVHNIGLALAGLGRHAEALDHFDRSLAENQKWGFRSLAASNLEQRGASLAALGDLAGARRSWQQALDLVIELGLPNAAEIRARLADPTTTDPTPTDLTLASP
ncbi:MAG TPA: BTAD domain-containing putative transcriptional regulator, partial [Pseudonocardiaceae bacterium]|nr:BTAD domain-containing putative transcriptional regulator [Pseudonocardiaceae bacterium]